MPHFLMLFISIKPTQPFSELTILHLMCVRYELMAFHGLASAFCVCVCVHQRQESQKHLLALFALCARSLSLFPISHSHSISLPFNLSFCWCIIYIFWHCAYKYYIYTMHVLYTHMPTHTYTHTECWNRGPSNSLGDILYCWRSIVMNNKINSCVRVWKSLKTTNESEPFSVLFMRTWMEKFCARTEFQKLCECVCVRPSNKW